MNPRPPEPTAPSRWPAVLFPALAGGMGWGIRGQYGHETGAMIAGLLVSLTRRPTREEQPASSRGPGRSAGVGTRTVGKDDGIVGSDADRVFTRVLENLATVPG